MTSPQENVNQDYAQRQRLLALVQKLVPLRCGPAVNATFAKFGARGFSDLDLKHYTAAVADLETILATASDQGISDDQFQLPAVPLVTGKLVDALNAVQRHLATECHNNPLVSDRIFQRNNRLARLNRNLLKAGVAHDSHYRENNALLIVDVSPKWLATRLERTMRFVGAAPGNPDKQHKEEGQKKKPKMVPKNASAELCGRLIEDNTRWDRIPGLFGTIEAPTLRADGSVLDAPGYDKITGLYLDPGETKFPKINNSPTVEQGHASIKMIDDLLYDFPFSDSDAEHKGVSHSVALSMIFTGPVRRMLPIAPAFAVDANEVESGKTELVKVTTGIMVGREVPGAPFSGSEEERRKSIGAALREGRPLLIFDNADKTPIEGDFLESILTLPQVTDRILGATESYTAPTNALMIFNGNHMDISDAMVTRVLQSRIVPDKPLAQRVFKYNPLFNHVIENRPALIAAVLTALRAYIVHGWVDVLSQLDKDGRRTFRFPEWSDLIAGAMIFYGYADPRRGGDVLRANNPAREAQREVVRIWHQKFADARVIAAELAADAEVRRAVAAAMKCRDLEVTPHILTSYLGKLVGVHLDLPGINGVVKVPTPRSRAQRWQVEFDSIDVLG